MAPVQIIALLVLGVLLWKRLVRIGCLLVSVPLLLLAKALIYFGFVRVGAMSAMAGVNFALWLDSWVQGK